MNGADPEKVGNPYLVFGTVQLQYWKEGLKQQGIDLEELRANTADIKSYYTLSDPRRVWLSTES